MRTPFKLRSSGTFKMMGSSPVKQTGLVVKGLKWLGKKAFSKKSLATASAVGASEQAISDNTKNRSTVEKIVRAADEWGPTMGLISHMYDNDAAGKVRASFKRMKEHGTLRKDLPKDQR